MIFHVDANSFYASCERLFRPDLYKAPIAVLTNNDGIIISLNRECKDLGFRRGDPYFLVKDACLRKGVVIFSSNYTLYNDMSVRLNRLYHGFAPEVEAYSIDESFLFFSGESAGRFSVLGEELKERTQREIGLPVSVGIAPSKTLAKLCNKLAKNSGGVCFWDELDQEKELRTYPVGEVWGIGRSKEAFLKEQGVRTAWDLKNYPLDRAKKQLSLPGYQTVRELNGIPVLGRTEEKSRQNIICSKSFAEPVASLDELETALADYTQEAVKRLREDGQGCRHVAVWLMAAFRNKDEPYFCHASAELPFSTAYLPDILNAAVRLLRQLYKQNGKYKKILVSLFGLEEQASLQQDFFEPQEGKIRKDRIMKSFDSINQRFGRGTLHLGTRDMAENKNETAGPPRWHMKREFLSPEYTTKLSDIPEVR